MGNLRKVIASISLVAILSTFAVTNAAFAKSPFSDVPDNHWFTVEGWDVKAKDTGIFTNTTAMPDVAVQRDALVKMVVAAADLLPEDLEELEAIPSGVFTDVKADNWLAKEGWLQAAFQAGVISENVIFNPAGPSNRAQAAKVIVEAFGLTEAAPATAVFPGVKLGYTGNEAWLNNVYTAYCYGLMKEGRPADQIKRGELAKMLVVAMDAPELMSACEEVAAADDDTADDTANDDDADDAPAADTPAATGDLVVAVSDSTPKFTTSIPDKATSVAITSWDFTAGSEGDANITALTIHNFGTSTLPSAHQVYLYDGDSRLTSGTSFNSTSNEAKFANLKVKIEKGKTKTLTARVDVGDGSAQSEVGIEIVKMEAVVAGDSGVTGEFPLKGNLAPLSTSEVGTLTVEKNGTLTNPKVGESGVTVAKFKLTSAGEGAKLSSLGLYLTGNINSADVQNLKLYVSGVTDPIATVAGVDSNDIVRFAPATAYLINKGDAKSFYVTADLNTGRNQDTIKLFVDQDSDVVALGDKYGYGLAITRTAYNGDTDGADADTTACSSSTDADCSYSLVEGGDLTITTSGPASTNVAVNGKDVHLIDFTITSVSEVTFKKFPVGLIASESSDTTEGLLNATAANLTDIKIINTDTGAELMTAVDSTAFKDNTNGFLTATTIAEGSSDGDATDTDDQATYHIFTDNFTMTAGQKLNLALTADIANTAALADMTVTASLPLGTSASYPEIRDVQNKVLTNSTSLTPASTITAKTMTIKSATLALSVASTPVSGANTYVKGAKAVPLTGMVFACGDASTCRVTDLTVTGAIDASDSGSATFITTAGSASGLSTTNAVQLNSIVGSVWLEDVTGKVVAPAKSVASTTGLVSFTNVNWTIPAGSSPVLYVKGDISSSAFKNSNGESVAFKITAASNVTAEDKDGNTITATGTVNAPTVTTADTYVVVSNGGSLTIAVDADTAQEDIIIAGATGMDVSKFKFTTTAEAFKVKNLSINNRQSAATTAALGNYDNNVKQVTITYKNSAGADESKTGSLVGGTAVFSGLDFYIGKDTSAVLSVKADTNTISSNNATAGEFVDLNLAFNNFEAIAEASGETYKADKIDEDVAVTSDLDFGTLTWVDPGALDVNLAVTAVAGLGSAQNLRLDDASAATPPNLPVGTLLCVSAGATCTVSTDDIFVVTAWTEGTAFTDAVNGDSVDTLVLNNPDAAFANNDDVLYLLPGTGYLADAKQMHVYETKPTLGLAAASPSGTGRSTASSDDAFIFTVAANPQEQVNLRAGTEVTGAALDGVGTPCAFTSGVATAGLQVDGASELCTLDSTGAGDTISFAVSDTVLRSYDRVSFWIKQVEGGSGAPQFADLSVSTGTAQAIATDGTFIPLSQTICGADQSTLVTAEWYFCDLALAKDVGTLTHLHFQIEEATEFANTDAIYLDEIWMYNDKIKIDIATDSDLDTYANNATNAGGPVLVNLKEGSTTKATGYVTTTTNGASATSTGYVTFIPTTQIEVAKNTTKTLTVNLNSGDLLNEDTGSDDPLTFSIALGSAADGTVTSGGFWWNDTNVDLNNDGSATAAELTASAIKWVGKVASTTFTSNTVKY